MQNLLNTLKERQSLKKYISKQNADKIAILKDNRFSRIFTDREYEIDKANSEYHRHHPNDAPIEKQESAEDAPLKLKKKDNAIRIFNSQPKKEIKKKHWKYNQTEGLKKRVAISAKSILKPKKRRQNPLAGLKI